MTAVAVVKAPDGSLRPADEEAEAVLSKIGHGEIVKGEFRRWRNYRFHKKFFALLKFAFDIWCERGTGQAVEYKGMTALPSFNRFRKDVIILAGRYETSVRVDGSVRVEAKSISFEKMQPEEFEALYDKTIDVILHKVIPQVSLTGDELRDAVNVAVGFAA